MPKKAVVREDPAQNVLAAVTQQFGPGSLIQLGSHVAEAVGIISTGSVGLNNALGIGGLPRGRVTEIYGPEGSGKTTLALHAIANAQKAGGLAVMIDAEHALDMDYAQVVGVDTDHLLLNQPDTGEQGLEIADMCIRSGVVDIVVVDSVAALVPKAEIEGEMGDSHPGLQARLMSQALRKMTPAVGSTKTACVFINQMREKIGVFYGNPEVTTGGKALKFYASVRLDIRRIETLKEGTASIGQKVRIKVVKNKLAPPFRQYETDIIWGRGLSREAELVELGVQFGLVRKGGAYYYLGADDGAAVQGKDKARQYLEGFPGVADELERQLRPLMAAAAPRARVVPTPSAEELDVLDGLADLVPPGGNDPETQ
jgi:recombination protein RecA